MVENEQSKKGFSKKVIAIIITTILIVGGAAAAGAFFFLAGSPKAEYFKAEKNTAEFLTEKVEERYQPEFDWLEKATESPIENTVELSAEYNGPPINTNGMSPDQIINNSTISITSQVDQDEKQMATSLKGSFGGIEIDDIKLHVDSDNAFVQLPFLEEILTIKDSELSELLQEVDPTFADAEIDFESLFNQMDGLLSEEDKEYLNKEYTMMVYDELPDDAFETADESVEIKGESIDSEKITFALSEEQLKDLMITVLEKAKDDERLKAIIEKQIKNQVGIFAADSLTAEMETEIKTTMEEFENSIDDAIDEIEDIQIPDGLTSVVWVKNDLIVKRDFSIAMAPKGEEAITLSITGDQLLNDSKQDLTYEFGLEESVATIDINLTNENDSLKDSVTISGGDMELSYEGESTLKDGTRDFDRVFSLTTPEPNGTGSLHWSGEATYEKDGKNAKHTLSMELPDMPQDFVSLNIKNDAKTIKEVDEIDESNVKDLGGMSLNELNMYFQTDVAGQFQQWLMELMGVSAGNNGF